MTAALHAEGSDVPDTAVLDVEVAPVVNTPVPPPQPPDPTGALAAKRAGLKVEAEEVAAHQRRMDEAVYWMARNRESQLYRAMLTPGEGGGARGTTYSHNFNRGPLPAETWAVYRSANKDLRPDHLRKKTTIC